MCQNIAVDENFYVQQNSSYCVNCPVSGSIRWRIGLDFVDEILPTSDYEVFPNNSLLMPVSIGALYQCGTFPNDHRFTVTVASEYDML